MLYNCPNKIKAAEIIHMYLWSYMDYKRVKKYFHSSELKLFYENIKDKVIMITTTYEPYFIIYVNSKFENTFNISMKECELKTPRILRGNMKSNQSNFLNSIQNMLEGKTLEVQGFVINFTSNNIPILCKLNTYHIDLTNSGYEEILVTYINCCSCKQTQTIK